ncbi:MAG: DUF935 family protein [Candidatus Margulisiibacteriota bacterium]
MAEPKKIKDKDQYEVEKAPLTKDLDIYGWGSYFENPDPVLSTEAKGKGIKLYDEINKDPHAGSVLQTRYLAVVGKEWSVVPAESPARAGRMPRETQERKIASFVESMLMACNFDQMRQEILQAILYGYWGTEIMWKVQDGSIVIDRFLGKHARRFCFTINRESRLLTPESMIEGEPLPDRKFLIFQCGDSDNPYGKGLGQSLWWPVWFKKHGIKFWVIFMEKFGMPTPLGKYPAQAKEQRSKLLDAIKAIQTETAIVIPDTMQVELMEAARQGDGSYLAACEYFDRQISKRVLGQTLTTEIGSQGSYAASQTHNEVRQDIIEADADLLDAYLNKVLISWIVDYNFPGVSVYPKLQTHASPKPDLSARAVIDKSLVDIGLPIAKSYFHETYGIPEPEAGEEVIEKQVLQPILPFSTDDEPAFAEGGKYTPEQQAIEDLVEITMEGGKRIFVEMESLIFDLAEKCDTLEEFEGKIFSLYPKMSAKKLEKLLANSTITAKLHGRATIAQSTQTNRD